MDGFPLLSVFFFFFFWILIHNISWLFLTILELLPSVLIKRTAAWNLFVDLMDARDIYHRRL